MDRVRIPPKAMVLVCDGAKALLFENAGDEQALDLKPIKLRHEPHPPTRDLGTERPGRTHESVGDGRSAQAGTDWHDRAEMQFAVAVAAELDEVVAARGTRHLVIAAPPRTLGVIRQHLSDRLRNILDAELDKDWTGLPVSEIEHHLAVLRTVR
jgi:protein required for attachment to host cells